MVELIIVSAAVVALAVLAVPAYNDYTVRAKVAECIAAAEVPKDLVSRYYLTSGRWPRTALEAGIDSSLAAYQEGLSDYCRLFYYITGNGDFAIWVDTGAIDSTLTGTQIIPVMSPVANPGSVNWFCTHGGTGSNALKYLPAGCRGDNIF